MKKQSFSKSFSPNKNWIFILGLVLLTIGLIFIFKQKSLKFYFEEQKENIADFYAQNLAPLFSSNVLTKEDIFNFAFYKELPMDKQNNQVLQLGNDLNGKEYFEFRKAAYNAKTNNLDQFTGLLELNVKQKQQLDSILNIYKEKIQTQVLVNDRNTLAINSDLWNLNKALMADLLLFASKTNPKKIKNVFPEEFYTINEPSVSKMVSDAKSTNGNNYIFVHSDTIFTKEFNFDKKSITSQIKRENQEPKVRIKIDNNFAGINKKGSSEKNNFSIKIDSNFCRVQIPDIPGKEMPDMGKITVELEKAAKQLRNLSFRFRTPVPPVPGVKINRKGIPIPPETHGNFELNIDLPNVDSIVHAAINASLEISRNMNFNLDSLETVLRTDSMMTSEEKESIKSEMKLLKKQLEKYKKSKKYLQESSSNSSDY